MLANKSILITGGTGSFGQAFIRRVLAEHPEVGRIVIFSRDELKQFEMQQTLSPEKYPNLRYFLGDVRDADRLRARARGDRHRRPRRGAEAGAGGRIQSLRMHQDQRAGRAEPDRGVSRHQGSSRGCAIDRQGGRAINLYGATKLCSDKLFTAMNNVSGKRDLRASVVRYGNVMGSRGSVIPFFLARRGEGELPITDPEMTRFNITLAQGVDMVLWALENAKGGELFVPKIPSYRILDIAEAIAPGCDKPVVGIRPGEKIHEEMITESDSLNTVDLGRYYAVLPSGSPRLRAAYIEEGASEVPKGFRYDSGSNPDFLSVEQLRTLIEDELGTGPLD